MRAKQALAWIARHKGAIAKLLLSVFALMVILFLPLRSETLLTLSIAPGALPDSATLVDNNTVAIVGTTSSLPSFGLNVTCSDIVKYGAKVVLTINITNSGTIYWDSWTGGQGVAYVYLCNVKKQVTAPGTTTVTITYLDVMKANPEGVPNGTASISFLVAPASDSWSAVVTVSGGATVRKPVYTAFTEPIAAAFSAIWGALLGFIRRVRSVMNSALGGFWSYFGISAFTGNVLLSLATAALIVYLVHYRHIFRPRKR